MLTTFRNSIVILLLLAANTVVAVALVNILRMSGLI